MSNTPSPPPQAIEKPERLEAANGSYWFTFGDPDEQIVSTVVDGWLYLAADTPGQYLISTIRNMYPRAAFLAPILPASEAAARDAELDNLRSIIKHSLAAAPVGNVANHTPANLPRIIDDLAKEVGILGAIDDQRDERDAEVSKFINLIKGVAFTLPPSSAEKITTLCEAALSLLSEAKGTK